MTQIQQTTDLVFEQNQLQDLAKEIKRQSESKRDFIASGNELELKSNGSVEISVGKLGKFGLNEHAHKQVSSKLDIPFTYYARMLEQSPELLSNNVNHWLKRTEDRHMVRTLDNRMRAFVSDKYRPLDNYDLLEAVLPIMNDQQLRVQQSAITERRFYLKAVFPSVQAEIKKGDIVQAGIVISNSEVGAGSLKLEALIYRLICLNGMVSGISLRKHHVSRRLEELGDDHDAFEYFSPETRIAEDKAFFLKVRDICKTIVSPEVFEKRVDNLREASEKKITGNVAKAIEVTSERFGFRETEKNGILQYLIEGGDLTQYGVANAVTRMAQDVSSYDRRVKLERMGYDVIELPKHDWDRISNLN